MKNLNFLVTQTERGALTIARNIIKNNKIKNDTKIKDNKTKQNNINRIIKCLYN